MILSKVTFGQNKVKSNPRKELSSFGSNVGSLLVMGKVIVEVVLKSIKNCVVIIKMNFFN